MGRSGARAAHSQRGPAATAAGVTASLARRLQRSSPPTITRAGGSAADVPPSDALSDWRGGRAGPSTLRIQAARLRAWRVAGVTIWHGAAQRSATQWSAAPCASSGPVRQAGASFTYTRRTSGPAIPGHGKGRLREHRRRSRPGRVARGMEARQGRDATAARCEARQPGPRSGDTPNMSASRAPLALTTEIDPRFACEVAAAIRRARHGAVKTIDL